MKTWKPIDWGEECSSCGSESLEVETDNEVENMAFDGDTVRCTKCGMKGIVSVYGVDQAFTSWGE